MRECERHMKPGWRCTRGFHEEGPCALIEEDNLQTGLGDRVQKALSQALHDYDGSTPSRWVLICESLEKDGTLKTWDMPSELMTPWEVMGMLSFANLVINARCISAQVKGDAE